MIARTPLANFSTRLLRREDLLLLEFEFLNLWLKKAADDNAPPTLVRSDRNQPSYVIVHFQPQSIAEEAFVEVITPPANEFEPLGSKLTDPPSQAPQPRVPPVQARIAGRSRLVFMLPQAVDSIVYTVESLLNWSQFELSLAPTALPPSPTAEDLSPRPKLAEPTGLQTAIEFPYRLFISPNRTAGWAHVAAPITHQGRTELWHTRLGVQKEDRVDEYDSSTRTVRAIWSPDYDPAGAPGFAEQLEFLTTLTPSNRHQIVRLSADFNIVTGYINIGIDDSIRLSPRKKLVNIGLDEPADAGINVGPGIGLDRYGREVLPSTHTPEITPELMHRITAGDAAHVDPHIINAITDRLVELDSGILRELLRIARYYDPQAIKVNQLMLTSQGAWANLQGQWGTDVLPLKVREPLGLSLVEWEHRATQGRDHYVRTVDLGYVLPTRNLAVKITITERKFETPKGSPYVAAYLRQRSFIVILQPDIHYQPGEFQHAGREMPFRQLLRFITRITPTLDPVIGIPAENIGTPTSGAHWIKVAGSPFQFQLQALDAQGQLFGFSTACIFVPLTVFNTQTPALAAEKATILNALPAAYKGYLVNGVPARTCFAGGSRVAFAPRNPAKEGNTDLQTDAFLLDLRPLNVNSGLPYVPFLETADVHIPAADQVAGGQGAQRIKLYAGYLNSPNGLLDEATNQGQVFAELVAQKAIKFSAEQAGGLTTPNIAMSGLSQYLGPVAGTLANVASGSFVPTDFFPASMNAKLLGGIDLFKIIAAVTGAGFHEQMPQLVAKLEPNEANPERIVTTMNWQPKVQSFAPLVVRPNATKLVIDVKLIKHLNLSAADKPPAAYLQGSLTAFDIEFSGIIRIAFNSLRFTKEDNKKLDVHVDIPSDGIVFLGPLKFLNELQKYFDPGSFADPPVLSVSPTGVSVGYTLTLPPLAVGVFTLKNISLGAILTLPFGGGPLDRMRVRFNLSERHSPFALAVLIFTGGGFFALSLGADGMEVLEVALEFGASFSLDVGVASGGVSAMAGIYFRLEVKPSYRLELTAYLRINGHLSVLGLISISIEFYLELSYKEIGSKNKLIGRATVTVKVEVLFFSTSVSMTVERKFSGSADDPTFSDMLTPGDWAEYGDAFA